MLIHKYCNIALIAGVNDITLKIDHYAIKNNVLWTPLLKPLSSRSHFNMKTLSYWHRNSHYKSWPSYIHFSNTYSWNNYLYDAVEPGFNCMFCLCFVLAWQEKLWSKMIDWLIDLWPGTLNWWNIHHQISNMNCSVYIKILDRPGYCWHW